MISAAARKIDGCPMEGFDPKAYDEVLGLTEKNLHSTLVFPIGYRSDMDKDKYQGSKVRKKLDDMVIRI